MSPRPVNGAAVKKLAEPKPCPTCFAPMTAVGTHYECVKHGQPVRA